MQSGSILDAISFNVFIGVSKLDSNVILLVPKFTTQLVIPSVLLNSFSSFFAQCAQSKSFISYKS